MLVMYDNDEKRSMAHFVQATHVRTRERLAKREEYPVPKVGDIIIYNQQQRFYEKHEPTPQRGVGEVTNWIGHNIVIKKLYMNGVEHHKCIRKIDFELGLYTYIELKRLPKECPSFNELEIGKLSYELKTLVKEKKAQGV